MWPTNESLISNMSQAMQWVTELYGNKLLHLDFYHMHKSSFGSCVTSTSVKV